MEIMGEYKQSDFEHVTVHGYINWLRQNAEIEKSFLGISNCGLSRHVNVSPDHF